MNEEMRRGEEAKRLLNEPLLKEAFQTVETALVDAMKRVDVGAEKAQKDLIVTLQLLGKVRGYLENVVSTGKMAELQTERDNWQARLKKRFR